MVCVCGHNSQLGSSTPSNLLHPAATSHHLSPLKPAPSRIRDDADDGQKSDSDACHPARPQPQHKRAAANTASAGRSSKATGVTVAPGAGEESCCYRHCPFLPEATTNYTKVPQG
ncbi:predicted protein [Coccidioides posadasii str. Silveira]|uniref:Predicted protein n=1 Tax=Coccidioides posadasii (strain RMSCC 757 / Silveira) TaxID=443226 RepID=E9CU48_COCPS|nr:predicted protein [Coccidioides posadasii str. Silveira]